MLGKGLYVCNFLQKHTYRRSSQYCGVLESSEPFLYSWKDVAINTCRESIIDFNLQLNYYVHMIGVKRAALCAWNIAGWD